MAGYVFDVGSIPADLPKLFECDLYEDRGVYKCRNCDKPPISPTVPIEQYHRHCGANSKEAIAEHKRIFREWRIALRTIEPGVAQQGWTYAKAVARWKSSGSPVRSPERIAEILVICEACPFFIREGRRRCKLCGCSINKQPDGLRNKIAMATESCPDNPPRWEAEVTPAEGS